MAEHSPDQRQARRAENSTKPDTTKRLADEPAIARLMERRENRENPLHHLLLLLQLAGRHGLQRRTALALRHGDVQLDQTATGVKTLQAPLRAGHCASTRATRGTPSREIPINDATATLLRPHIAEEASWPELASQAPTEGPLVSTYSQPWCPAHSTTHGYRRTRGS